MKRTRECAPDADADAAVAERACGVFCAVVAHGLSPGKKGFHTLLAADPLAALVLHNQRAAQVRVTRTAAPYCYPLMVAGPFYVEEAARNFAHDAVHGTRGLASFCRQFAELAQQYRVPLYADTVVPPEGIAAFLCAHGAPRAYRDALAVLEEAARVLLAAPA